MRIPSLVASAFVAASAVVLATVPAAAQPKPASSIEARRAALNALFEESWQMNLKLSPQLATAVGDYRYNDQLGDNSLAAVARRHEINAGYLARIKAISPEGFSEEERTSHDLFLRNLQEGMDDYDLKNYRNDDKLWARTTMAHLIAHEYGHHIQRLTGITAASAARSLTMSADAGLAESRRSRPP